MISVEQFLAAHPVRQSREEAGPDASDAGGVSPLGSVSHAGSFGSVHDGTDDGLFARRGHSGRRAEFSRRSRARRSDRRYAAGRRDDGDGFADEVPADGGIPDAGYADGKHDEHGGRQSFRGTRQPDDPCDEDACREAALTLLDAAPRASGALAERLCGKGYERDVVDRVIARLIEVNLLDDEAYAQSVLRACIARNMGARGVLQELRRKSVDPALAARTVSEASECGAFEECAWELGRQVAAKTAGLDREVRYRRFWSAGGRRGHSPEMLRAVARELFG